MKAGLLIVVSTVVLVTGSVLAVMNKPAKQITTLGGAFPHRTQRSGAPPHRIRSVLERRPDRDSERVGGGS